LRVQGPEWSMSLVNCEDYFILGQMSTK
jgi:hypothetical protein